MRFASIGSGSRGNATIIATDTTTVMVDCGFSLKETEQRLSALNLSATDVDAILVTHEHGDHIKGIGAFARRHNTPVCLTHGTSLNGRFGAIPRSTTIRAEVPFQIGDLTVTPFSVPHDAAEPCQFKFSHRGCSLGVLTDTGRITPHIVDMLDGIDALLLECNHDLEMLLESEYPESLKLRVGGDYGHLNNTQAAGLLADMNTTNLRYVAAMHLSENNNTPQLAKEYLSSALQWETGRIDVAHQDLGLDWVRIE